MDRTRIAIVALAAATLSCCDMPRRSGVEGRPSPALGHQLGERAALAGADIWRKASRPEGLVRVPGGPFQRGSDEAALEAAMDLCKLTYARPRACQEAWFEHEAPRRTLTLNTFFIDRHEVTQSEYAQCVEAGACAPPAWERCDVLDLSTGQRRTGPREGLQAPNLPVVCVDWGQARAFCAWAGGRLPTEAEWEKAARGPEGARELPWGEAWDPAALNWGETGGLGAYDGHEGIAPVGAYPRGASPYGALDMGGNVWEWVADWYDPDFYKDAPELNPVNLKPSRHKGLRGGAWSFAGSGARVAFRHLAAPDRVEDGVGFRCVRIPKEASP